MDVYDLLKLLLGLTFFMFGMKVMSGNLEKLSGGKLEQLLQKATANPFISLALGAVITIAVQSSSATTVMLVGLVNSGIMQFAQTLNVIFGANIGTTLTSWILSLSQVNSDSIWINMLKPVNFSAIFAFIGIIFAMFSKKEKRISIGTIFVGFSILMYGMEFMKDAVAPLAELPQFEELLVNFNNPIIGVLVGTLFTALIQSSAASIGILQALALTGTITNGMALPIVMGQNIGTCATSLISCIGTNTNAKRVATVHVSIKIIGTIILLSVYCALNAVFDFAFDDMKTDAMQIALIHTVFNILTTVICMPFTKWLVKMTELIIKEKSDKQVKPHTVPFIDERLLLSPSVAIVECNNATNKMFDLAWANLNDSMMLFNKYSESKAKKILDNEAKIDKFEDKLGTYLVKLSAQALSESDSQIVSKMLHAIGDFERLSDHAVNLVKVAKELHSKGVNFTNEASDELKMLCSAIEEILDLTINAYKKNDVELAAKVEPLEQVIDHITSKMKNNHISRLQRGECTIEMGFIFSDLLNNYERISDHCSNIAVAIIEVVHNSFDTHKYLNGIKYGNSEFNSYYEYYVKKYSVE